MDAPAVLYALRWLIHDTFRQTLTSRVFWIMLSLSALSIVFCLGVSVEGGAIKDEGEIYNKKGKLIGVEAKGPAGSMSLMFGLLSEVSFSRTAEGQVQFLLNIFASWIAGTIGILMALVWTAGFVPESLHPSAASVLLAKPVPRWLFLTGKYLGVVCFVALQVTIFFVGTWLALGVKTNIWTPEYLLGIPLLVFHFAVIYAFSVMLAVLFRSTTACVVGVVLFWAVCFAINWGRHFTVAYADMNPGGPPLSGFTMFLSELGYWLLPKPVDYRLLLERSMQLGDSMMALETQAPFKNVLDKDDFHPLLIIVSSCGFPVFALWAAAAQLSKTDY